MGTTINNLTAITSPLYDDITNVVSNPSTDNVDKKSTLQGLVKGGASEGAVSDIIDANLTASKALASDASGKVSVTSVTSTELGYVSGVTSAIQTQLDAMVEKSGDTMTGDLEIEKAESNIDLDSTSGTFSRIRFLESGTPKAQIAYDLSNNLLNLYNNTSGEQFSMYDTGGTNISADLTVSKTTPLFNLNYGVSSGCAVNFKENGSDKGSIGQSGTGTYISNATSSEYMYSYDAGDFGFQATVRPITTETYDLGSATYEWDNIYSQNAVTVSDERYKRDIEDESLGLDFISKLRPVSFKYTDKSTPAVTKEVTKEIQETELKNITESYVEIINGEAIQKSMTVQKEVPLFNEIDLKDENGNIIGKHKVPVMKTIIETVIEQPEVNITHGRPHSGLIAQEVKAVLNDLNIDHAVYSYCEEADKHHLRYSELIGILIKSVQELQERVIELESK